MSKLLTVLTFLTCCVMAGYAQEDDFIRGDLIYKILDYGSKTVSVTGVVKESQAMTVPSSILIEGEVYTVTEINDQAFENSSIMESIELPETLMAIRYMAFGHCRALKELKIPSNVITIENWVFEACTSLTKVDFSPSLTLIGSHAFDNCTALEEVILPESLEEISSFTFNECKGLKRVLLPKNLKVIGQSGFYECKSLEYIPFPNTLNKIEHGVFGYCTSLKEVTIPESLTIFETGVFDSCTSLKSIYCLSTIPPTIYANCFNRLDFASINVYVPDYECRYTYALSQGWSRFPDFIAMKTINDEVYNLEGGNSLQLEATVPAFMTANWTVSDPEIAAVDAVGLLTGRSGGETNVILTLKDAFGVQSVQTAKVNVSGFTAIEEISNENSIHSEYYSLEGVKVNSKNISPGIYIQVKDGEAKKILVK